VPERPEGSLRGLTGGAVGREVLERRFADGNRDGVESRLEGLGARLEVLPDRILVDTDDGEDAVRAVHERGIEPDSILVRRSTLEDVFLTLTGRTLVD